MKKTMSGGNLGSQKFEARRNMELFQAAVHDAKPSRETSKWREGVPKLHKRIDGRKLMKEKVTKMENLELGKKIFEIHHEPRQKATREYVPGWRIGNISGGMCIDCYATENPLVKVFAELHNFKEKRKALDKRIALEDKELRKHIAMYTSDLSAAAHKKLYDYNRYRARFFFNKESAAVLHLGLQKRMHKSKRPASATGASAGFGAGGGGGPPLQPAPGTGMRVNTYTGDSPTRATPLPASPLPNYRGSNLCYSVKGASGGAPPSAFAGPDPDVLTDYEGNVVGHMRASAENDRLLLQSMRSLPGARPSSAGARATRAARPGGAYLDAGVGAGAGKHTSGLREAVRSSRPGSAGPASASSSNPFSQQPQRERWAGGEAGDPLAQRQARDQLLRPRDTFPYPHGEEGAEQVQLYPYSQAEWELFHGAMEAGQGQAAPAAAPSASSSSGGGARPQQKQKQRQELKPRATTAGHTRTRSLRGVGRPSSACPAPPAQAGAEPWRSSPPTQARRAPTAHIYAPQLLQNRLGASEEAGAALLQGQQQENREEAEEEEEAEPFSLGSAQLDAFSTRGTRRQMFDRLRSAQAAAERQDTDTALYPFHASPESRLRTSPSPPRFPPLSAHLSRSPQFPAVESDKSLPYSQYAAVAADAAEDSARGAASVRSDMVTPPASISAAALSVRLSMSKQITPAERASELALLQETLDNRQRRKEQEQRRRQKKEEKGRGRAKARAGMGAGPLPKGKGGLSALSLLGQEGPEEVRGGAAPVTVGSSNQREGHAEAEVEVEAEERAFHPRKSCLLRTQVLQEGCGLVALQVFDVGVTWDSPEGAGEGGGSASVLTSSGVLVEASSSGGQGKSELFVPIAELRLLSCSEEQQQEQQPEQEGGRGLLAAELRALRSVDKGAGLYDALAERLSSAAEHALSDALLQRLEVRLHGQQLRLALRQ